MHILGKLPDPKALAHVKEAGDPTGSPPKGPADPPQKEKPTAMHIGAGLPPVPPKPVQKIQAGEYVDMAELLPDRLGVNAGPPVQGDKDNKKPKHRQVTNILDWIKCYTIYMAVRADKHPEKIRDMLGYQTLIVEA